MKTIPSSITLSAANYLRSGNPILQCPACALLYAPNDVDQCACPKSHTTTHSFASFDVEIPIAGLPSIQQIVDSDDGVSTPFQAIQFVLSQLSIQERELVAFESITVDSDFS
jgi:hypothetical protein